MGHHIELQSRLDRLERSDRRSNLISVVLGASLVVSFNMGVSPTGRGWIRFLDHDTRAKMFILVDQNEAGVVQFLDWTADKRIFVREDGFKGRREFEWK